MGSWHLNHALTVVDRDGRVHRLVLRRWARLSRDRDDPDYTAAPEMTVLELLRPKPMPAPVQSAPTSTAMNVRSPPSS
jgi:hypothetical protein